MVVFLLAITSCTKELVADFEVEIVDYRDRDYEKYWQVLVYDKSKNANSCLWEWGDESDPQYSEPGTMRDHFYHYSDDVADENGVCMYTIGMTVTNEDGQSDYKSKTIRLEPRSY